MADRIPLEIFYNKVAQKLGKNATPTQARRYGEAIQDVLYEQLLENEECYWYGFGNFLTTISKRSDGYKEITAFQSDCRREMRYLEPKLMLKFKPAKPLIEGLREGEEKLKRPNITHKRKYKNAKEYQSAYNAKRRKKIQPVTSLVDDWCADAMYGYEGDEEVDELEYEDNVDTEEDEENGEEGYDED